MSFLLFVVVNADKQQIFLYMDPPSLGIFVSSGSFMGGAPAVVFYGLITSSKSASRKPWGKMVGSLGKASWKSCSRLSRTLAISCHF